MSSILNFLLNHADLTLNMWDMFLKGLDVKSNACGGKCVLEGGKFAIRNYFGYIKAAVRVY